MKRLKFLLLFVLIGISASAKDKVVLHPLGPFGGIRPHEVPDVSTDGDDINIRCDSTINDVDIVIRDQYGAVMHQSTQTIGPDETSLYVPDVDGDSEKTTIDLYYDRKHLSGYFEE